jgi:hypothetical protein
MFQARAALETTKESAVADFWTVHAFAEGVRATRVAKTLTVLQKKGYTTTAGGEHDNSLLFVSPDCLHAFATAWHPRKKPLLLALTSSCRRQPHLSSARRKQFYQA